MLGTQDRTVPTGSAVVSIEEEPVASYGAQSVPRFGQGRFWEVRPAAVGSDSEAPTALPLSCVGSAVGGDGRREVMGRREGRDPLQLGDCGVKGPEGTLCTPFQPWQA